MKGARILVVDDDPDVRGLVEALLTRAGALVRQAPDGRTGLREVHTWRPDLVVLDVSMPHLDGFQTLERIRDLSEVPVLMLTARGDELERVRGLQSGADDYVVKPFGRQELVARVQALLRRAPRESRGDEADTYADGYLAIDYGERAVAVGDREVRLTPLEFKLLATFVRNPRQVLSRDQLLDLSRLHSAEVYDRSIDVQILRLRRKIEVDPAKPRYIVTERGIGYLFDAAVEVLH